MKTGVSGQAVGRRPGRVLGACMALGLWAAAGLSDETALFTQTVQLQAGWNAVFLSVDPTNTAARVLFQGVPVDVAATHFESPTLSQFSTSASANKLLEMGWSVWYAPERPDAFLTTLRQIDGQRGYLLHATQAFVWRVPGLVCRLGVAWSPDAFTLAGFALDAAAPPTFAQFFAGSPAHAGAAIYRLAQGAWRKVTQPAAELMRDGEAFWIYTRGPSDYQGPLRVETRYTQGLSLRGSPDALVLRNEAGHPVAASLKHLPQGDAPLPLSLVLEVLGDPQQPLREAAVDKPAGAWELALPPLEAGASLRVPVAARQAEMSQRMLYSVIEVKTDMGTVTRIPVLAAREDLP